MQKIISVLLVCVLLVGCTGGSPKTASSTVPATESTNSSSFVIQEEELPDVVNIDEAILHRHIENAVYSELVTTLDSEEYFVENVEVVYISKEYLEEVEYNSLENVYFGYTLSELDEIFQGTRYVFTWGIDGQTTFREFKEYEDVYGKMIRDVAIGAGVILLCVTVSVVSGGLGAPAISMIFAASAKTGATMGLASGVFGGVSAGIVTGMETGDFDEALQAAAVAGSEGFKWGVISGTISSGVSETIKYGQAMQALKGAQLNGLTIQQAAAIQMESGYPVDVIKQFSNMEQYEVCRSAGLTPHMVNGKMALVRNIDLDMVDDMGRTNLQRMQQGYAALDSTGTPYELHHIGQKADSTLAILTKAEHMQGGNNKIWHVLGEASEVHGAGNTWDQQRQQFWKQLASLMV